MLTENMKPRNQKRRSTHHGGKMRGGKLMPVAIVPFEPSESGVVSQKVMLQLEPVAGRLVTNIVARVTSVYVPALAVDALMNADNDYPGNEEIFRQRLLSGEDVFPLEPEGELTQRMSIVPAPIAGNLLLSSVSRLAHNAAVNYLRQRKYVKATKVSKDNDQVTPAIISDTVLDRFNAVLDPDDHVDGAVSLVGEVPVRGLYYGPDTLEPYAAGHYSASEEARQYNSATANMRSVAVDRTLEEPRVFADFDIGSGQELSLKQFYIAEKIDAFTRRFRQIVDANPEHGEDIVARIAHGLKIETGKMPYVVYEKTVSLNRGMKSGMDGPNLDYEETHVVGGIDYTLPVGANEFGGVLITFVEVKPDEVIRHQPDPSLTKPWSVHNHVADQLALDPVPVRLRDLDAEVDIPGEDTVAMYVGHNHLSRQYVNHGWRRGLDTTTVSHRNAWWQYEIPLSVSPDNILYPDVLDHYPFALNGPEDEACSYTVHTDARIATNQVFGPTPVEQLAALDSDGIYLEDEQ